MATDKVWAIWDINNSEFVSGDTYSSEAEALDVAKELAIDEDDNEGYIILEAILKVSAPKNVIVENLRPKLLPLNSENILLDVDSIQEEQK